MIWHIVEIGEFWFSHTAQIQKPYLHKPTKQKINTIL